MEIPVDKASRIYSPGPTPALDTPRESLHLRIRLRHYALTRFLISPSASFSSTSGFNAVLSDPSANVGTGLVPSAKSKIKPHTPPF